MKITIYELLGMIKDGKAPKKIKVTGTIYYFDEKFNFYFTKTKKGNLALGGKLNEINLLYNFNNENNVEILEEEKKIPEKLNIEDDGNTITLFGEKENEWTILDNVDVSICNKINEIIDYLKSEGE